MKKTGNDGKYIFHNGEQKLIKRFAEKSFSVFGGAHGRPLKTQKLFFGKKVLFFFLFTLMKNTFAIISRFFAQELSRNMICRYNTF